VYKITPAGQVSTIVDLPDGDEGYVGPIFDPVSGNLLVSRDMNRTGNEILQITPAGAVSVFASQIPRPVGLITDGQGTVFVSNYSCPGTVTKVTSTGSSVFATGLCMPDGLALGPNGDLFVGDRGTNRVMRVPANGGQATVFATGFFNPMDVEFDRSGQLFVTNYDTGTIAVVDSSGVVSPFVSGLVHPAGMVFDQQNRLFIADYGAGQILGGEEGSAPSPTPTATTTPSPTATPTNTAPPIADRLTINGGALTTTSVNVHLDVSASNAGGGQAGLSMSFSNDRTSWSDWQGYATSMLWQLTSGDGMKTVYGRFKNSGGAISAIVSDTITLDTKVQPEYGVTINDGALYTCRVEVQLTLSARPRTAAMQISNDGGFVGAAWEPYSVHRVWQITAYGRHEIPRLVYARFRDVDGNVSTASDDIILDVDPPTGHVDVAATDGGALLELSATDDLSGVSGMRVSARLDFSDASWEPFASSRAWDFAANPTVFVQFRDAAGNLSPAYPASLSGTSTLFLPLVLR
jgi:NHL repeat